MKAGWKGISHPSPSWRKRGGRQGELKRGISRGWRRWTVWGEDKEEGSLPAFGLAGWVLTGFFKRFGIFWHSGWYEMYVCFVYVCHRRWGGHSFLGMPAPALGSTELGYGVRGAGPFCVGNTVWQHRDKGGFMDPAGSGSCALLGPWPGLLGPRAHSSLLWWTQLGLPEPTGPPSGCKSREVRAQTQPLLKRTVCLFVRTWTSCKNKTRIPGVRWVCKFMRNS